MGIRRAQHAEVRLGSLAGRPASEPLEAGVLGLPARGGPDWKERFERGLTAGEAPQGIGLQGRPWPDPKIPHFPWTSKIGAQCVDQMFGDEKKCTATSLETASSPVGGGCLITTGENREQ